ncbi:probable inactive tRNA-specific adenosine deaminase-like protein 3 [Phymastichus coffea]|uniref:probable inactive tRNA-specific adenosine deaminase-like protein 3 n=1 Tax=Phymastichus coffea TaxID=108790 RepID=UPI00273B6CF0|nr:probable inactive tRNA-specific adenosine deaminase-like protein 3 [Phymastichus coffea]
MDTEEQPNKKRRDDEEDMTNRKVRVKPKPVLFEELTQLPVLEKSYVGVLKDKKNISKSITGLTNCLPCPQYLKRCSGLRIFLSKVIGTPEDLKQFMIQNGFDMSILEDKFEIVDVPAAPPRTRAQMAYGSKFWPMNFHPDLNLEAFISGSLFDDDQLASLETCIRLAISAAQNTAVGSRECNGSAVIVDPEEGKVLAIAASSVDKHPMWHASLIAVDLIAKIQGGGAWRLLNDFERFKLDKVKRKFPDDLPLRYPDSLFTIEVSQESKLTFEKKEGRKLKNDLDVKCGPYLCTGYWAILLQEPCPLCAMALLHSRVSRIFYGAANLRTGILGSKAILHSVPGLNHRYQVWSGILEDECNRILETCQVIDS